MFSTFILQRNVSWTANKHIRMISEESCDTEHWSNDAENSALHHNCVSKKRKKKRKENISQYDCFYCSFDQINSALVSIRDFFQ